MTKFDCRILSNIEVEYGFQSNIFNSEKSVSNGAKIVEYSSNMRFSNIRVHHYQARRIYLFFMLPCGRALKNIPKIGELYNKTRAILV